MLVTAITPVCSGEFLLFGHDQGVMSGVVLSEYWLGTMGGKPGSIIVGTLVAIYDVGVVSSVWCHPGLGLWKDNSSGAFASTQVTVSDA